MARLSRNDIREAAIRFAHDWHDETRERGEAQTFWTEFLAIFGNDRRRVHAAFEQHGRRTSTGGRGFIDLLWPKMLLAEHKSRGASLDLAMEQALDYVDGLSDRELPRLVVVSDFARMRVLDLDADSEPYEFDLLDLSQQIDRFLVLAGYESRPIDDEPEANIKAAELLGKVYEEIESTGYPPHALGRFMVRILFLLFADDTGLWRRGWFRDLLRNRTSEDGADLGMWITKVFSVLDTEESKRSTILDEDLSESPFVNGGLFEERVEAPDTNRSIRDRLLDAAEFDWSSISPAVFGSIFQSVMDSRARRSLGAHYTSESNILKLIRPLFLDSLEEELDRCGSSKRKLTAFHERLGELRFLDPACGCGNFLVVAYRELRRLEGAALMRLYPNEVQLTTELDSWRKVSLDQFHGIELEEFPAQIAETAMYLVDHQENAALGRNFGVSISDLPLKKGTSIRVGNALRIPWDDVIEASACSFLLGNPPYVGKHLLSEEQKADLALLMDGGRVTSSMDYVAGWFLRAADYLERGPHILGAFVATNSITQGEQVPLLWPVLHERQLHITFGWRTFNWTSEGRGAAHVHVVVVGFAHSKVASRGTLYEYDSDADRWLSQTVPMLNGFLTSGGEVYPKARGAPLLSRIPRVVYGAKPADGGSLLLTAEEAAQIRRDDPTAAQFIRPMLSATEFLNGQERFCLWLVDADPTSVRSSSELRRRLAAVEEFRGRSPKQKTREMAALPGLFAEVRRPSKDFIFIPRHASASRRIIPMGFIPAEWKAVVHDSGAYVEGASLAEFGLLQSEMFGAWQRTLGGRIKSDYRFNNRLVYNTFPFPNLSDSQEVTIAAGAQAVLDARAAFPDASLADLYSREGSTADLIRAHRQLDKAVDAAFGRRKTPTEAERLALLFEHYVTQMSEQDQ